MLEKIDEYSSKENTKLYDPDSIRQRCLERFSEKAFILRVEEIYKHCIAESINA